MKLAISILFFVFSVFTFGQIVDLKGHVRYLQDSSDFIGVNIFLIKDGNVALGGVTDSKGNYEIKGVPIGIYSIKLSFIGTRDKLIPNFSIDTDIENLNFIYPDPCKHIDKVCPYGHRDNLLPIQYGLPGTRLLKKAEKGKIWLGGCIVTDCDPKWHCKVHKIEF